MDKNKIFIVGDSAVRAFAYNSFFIPIQIATGVLNATLDEERYKSIRVRYFLFFEEFNLQEESVWFFASANPYHYNLDTFNLKELNNQEVILKNAASKYVELIIELTNKYKLKASIVSSVPIMDGEALNISFMYNNYLKHFAEIYNLEYIDLWDLITINHNNNIKIDSRYVADIHGHLSHFFIPNLLKKYNFEEFSYDRTYFNWYYAYELITPYFKPSAKIWGDFHSYDLILNPNETHFWRRYHKKTRLHISLAIEALSFYNQIFGLTQDKEILFIGSKEGYVPFRITSVGQFKKIDAFEGDVTRVSFAKKLQKTLKREDINFSHSKTNEINKNYNIAISLTRSNYTAQMRMKFFTNVFNNVDFFIFYSFDEERDLKLLNKVGYKHIFRLNYLQETNKILDSGESLFICTNIEYAHIKMFIYKFKKLKHYLKKIKDISMNIYKNEFQK